MIVNPCKSCDSCEFGCHSTCNRYKLWKAIHVAELRKIRKNLDECNIINDQSIQVCHGRKRRKGV